MAAKRKSRKKPAAAHPKSRRKGKSAQGVSKRRRPASKKTRQPARRQQVKRKQPKRPARPAKKPAKRPARRPATKKRPAVSKKRTAVRGIEATKARRPVLSTREQERVAKVDRLISQLRGTPRSNRKRREALALEIVRLESRSPVGGRAGRHTRGRAVREKRPGKRDLVLEIPDVKTRRASDYKKAKRTVDLENVGRARKIGRTQKFQSGGWWERYERAQANRWVSKKGKQLPKVELRNRTIYERIRDQLLAFPPEMRERLVLRIRSKTLAGTLDQLGEPYGKSGIAIRVSTDDELALGSIPGLLYAAGVRETPDSPGESTPEIEIDWFLEADDIDIPPGL